MEIARKYFMSLVLDREGDGLVVCRILNDGWYVTTLIASDRETAIKTFLEGNYKTEE